MHRHADDTPWHVDETVEAHRNHAVFGWGVNSEQAHDTALRLSHGDGVFLVDVDGKRYFDMTSGGFCANLGHTLPPAITAAVTRQMETLYYAWPDNTVTEVRARLSDLLAAVMPGDLDAFLYPSSGAEANETAVRIARVITGRHKIMSSYRASSSRCLHQPIKPGAPPMLAAHRGGDGAGAQWSSGAVD